MKLMRVGPKGHEKPALLDAQGKVRDLSGILCDITPHNLTPEGQADNLTEMPSGYAAELQAMSTAQTFGLNQPRITSTCGAISSASSSSLV